MKNKKSKIIRISTIPISLSILLRGQLRFLANYFSIIAISSDGPELQDVAVNEGVQVFAVNIEREISPFKDFISLIKLFLKFKKEKPSIVHSITPKAGLLSMIAAKFAGVPIRIHTFTGLVFPTKRGLMRWLLISMDKLLCWAATNIYPEGKGVMNDLKKFSITRKPLKVLANGNVNGINTDFFNPANFSNEDKLNFRARLGIAEDDFIFIYVGRIVGDKGINELICAFEKLQANNKNIKLLLVGQLENELDPIKEETQNSIKNNDSIISVGFQIDVRPFLAISQVFTLPSYREGFPNVVLQAGAMQLPSIVSNINGCNEIIVDEENGLIVPPKNIEYLLNAMQKLLSDKILTKELVTNARKMVVERYEQEDVWQAILSEYVSAIQTCK